jgi:serine/threonine protein kinase/ankyrin repeat protein
LVLEFADFGTFDALQKGIASPLAFKIKQKLLYDIGRGLSVLHACGIVHGDLKHENVLIFRNKQDYPKDQPYTAKLADFGGAVMDMADTDGFHLHMGTVPWGPPEGGNSLTADEIKSTDTYSFGLLAWRAFIDCQDPFVAIGFKDQSGPWSDDDRHRLKELKQTGSLLLSVLQSIKSYGNRRSLPEASIQIMSYIVHATIQPEPARRSLIHAQSRLRGIAVDRIDEYLAAKDRENMKRDAINQSMPPGKHGIDQDALGYALGRMGDDFDIQDNLPGYRPNLPHPSLGNFLFDPVKLKNFLDWRQQVAMIEELERLAAIPHDPRSTELQPWAAAFNLFKSYIAGFGCEINLEKACNWLYKASRPEIEAADTDYFAKAWLTRVSAAAGIPSPLNINEQMDDLFMSILRGHAHCVEDSAYVITTIADPLQAQSASARIEQAIWACRATTGWTGNSVNTSHSLGTSLTSVSKGMPHYVPRNLSREWDLHNLAALDADIQLELGYEYESCIRSGPDYLVKPEPSDRSRFDQIYVNKKGHGLLHYAATVGQREAMHHIFQKYQCNINLPNQSMSETPLVCACRVGNLACALFCLDNGADPNGNEFGEETPLHWVSSFKEEEMPIITMRLIEAGADVSRLCRSMRKGVRKIMADWEDRLSIPLTPLGRAVLMKSLPAVKVLLELTSSDPHLKGTHDKLTSISAIELAAVLTLPEILEILLIHQSAATSQEQSKVPDECKMLHIAHDMPNTGAADPLILQSRIVRCGFNFRTGFSDTMRQLRDWRLAHSPHSEASELSTRAACLCDEVRRGSLDTVQSMLEVGFEVDGVPGTRPLAAAVAMNNMAMFHLLLSYGGEVQFETGEETLLQVFASKPRTVSDSLAIADFLIENAIPVEAAQGDSPSPLALAIKNGYFALGDLLIAHGAGESVNFFYQWHQSDDMRSLLGAILQSHSFSSLLAIHYLAAKHREQLLQLQPLVDAGAELSALHLLALQPPGHMNFRRQVSARIIHSVLEIFPSPESLGEYAIHEDHGTPLTAAISAANETVVTALLESELHLPTVHTPVIIESLRENPAIPQPLSPITLVIIQFMEYAQGFQRQGTLTQEQAHKMKHSERLAHLVIEACTRIPAPNGDASAQSAVDVTSEQASMTVNAMVDALSVKTKELEQDTALLAARVSSLALGEHSVAVPAEEPVDLSQMTERSIRNWWDKDPEDGISTT